jgi:hypothetical protein
MACEADDSRSVAEILDEFNSSITTERNSSHQRTRNMEKEETCRMTTRKRKSSASDNRTHPTLPTRRVERDGDAMLGQ